MGGVMLMHYAIEGTVMAGLSAPVALVALTVWLIARKQRTVINRRER